MLPLLFPDDLSKYFHKVAPFLGRFLVTDINITHSLLPSPLLTFFMSSFSLTYSALGARTINKGCIMDLIKPSNTKNHYVHL